MSKRELTIGNAISHFSWTGGPKGFLLRFALGYAVVSVLVQGISFFFQAPIYEIYIRAFTEGDGDLSLYMDEMNRVSMQANLGSLLLLPISLLMWVMFEAASQRRYMRGEGLRLTVGADEGRMAIVGLIWIALLIGAYIGLIILVLVPVGIGALIGGAAVAGILGVVGGLAGLAVMLWIFARLAPAASLTIRDRQIRFFEAWRVTRGRAGTLFASYLVLFLLMMVIYLIGYGLVFMLGYMLIAPGLSEGSASAEAVLAAMSAPGFWIPVGIGAFLLFIVGAAFMHVFGGPAALAAKTDPDWSGDEGVVHTFA